MNLKKKIILGTSISLSALVAISTPIILSSCAQSSANQPTQNKNPNPNGNGNNTTKPETGLDGNNNGNIDNQLPNPPTPVEPTPPSPSPEQPQPPVKPPLPVDPPMPTPTVELQTNLNQLYSCLKSKILDKNVYLVPDVQKVLQQNQDEILNLINPELSLCDLKNIQVSQNQINFNFKNVALQNNRYASNDSNKINLISNNNSIIVSNLNFDNKAILSGDEKLIDDNNYKPTWNPVNGGYDLPGYSMQYVNNSDYNGDRTRFENQDYYHSELSSDANFPGFPSFSNNWSVSGSHANNKITNQSQSTGEDFNTVKNNWRHRVISDTSRYLNPNFIEDEIKNNSFKKYEGAINTYGNFDVPYSQNAVSRTYHINSFYPSNFITGLYAPAGEVITMKIPTKYIEALKSMDITINMGHEWVDYNDSYALSFRLPKTKLSVNLNWLIQKNMTENNYEGDNLIVKFGTPIGGTIIFRSYAAVNVNKIKYGTISYTIEGAVEYAHYIDGFTTDEEWFRLVNTTNVPVFSVQGANVAITKPWFHNNADNNDLRLKDNAKLRTPKYHLDFYNNIFKLSHYISSTDLGFQNESHLRNQFMIINDFIPAGYACNVGGQWIAIPSVELDGIFNGPESIDTGAENDWCIEHEGNHSYEQRYHLFNWHIGETWNNVGSIVANAVMADETYTRNKDHYVGWMWTNNGYTALNPRKADNEWLLTERKANTDANAAYIHSVGTKYAVGLFRTSSLIRKYLKDTNNTLITDKGNYQLSALSYLILNSTPKVNMMDFIRNTSLYSDGRLSSDTELQNQFKVIYDKYVKNLPVYHPVGNFYASGPYLPRDINHTTWEYGGDSVRPYLVDDKLPTHFDMLNNTKFTHIKNDQLATLKSVRIVNQPKYGTVRIDDNKLGFTYTPNSNAKINDMDELIVEIQDSFGELNRILIRPQMYYFDSYTDEIITYNPGYAYDGANAEYFLQYNTTKLVNDLDRLSKDHNFAKNIKSSKKLVQSDTPYLFDGQDINHNEIRHLKFVWRAPKTGYYRINLDVDHGNWTGQDYGYVSQLTESNSRFNVQQMFDNGRWLANANGNAYSSVFEKETKPFVLQKDGIYIFDFICFNKSGSRSPTIKKVALNYLGDSENDKNKQQIDYSKQPLANSVILCNVNNYQQAYESLTRERIPLKKYYWFVENSDVYKIQEDLYPINIPEDQKIWNQSIGSVATYEDVKPTKYDYNNLVDPTEDTVKRFLGIWNNWTQFQSGSADHTEGGFDITLKNPISFKWMQIRQRVLDASHSCQKIRITDLDTNTVVYDDYIDGWWNEYSSIYLNKLTTLQHFRIQFIRAVDNRSSTPTDKQEYSRNNLKQWIILYSNPLTFSKFANSSDSNTYKYMDYAYSIFNDHIQALGAWNITNNNAIWESKQLISRYNSSKIRINIDAGISKIGIIGDQYNTSVKFNVYVNNQLYGQFNNQSNNPLPASVLALIDLDKNKSNEIVIEVVDNNANNPFSFQGITLKK